MDLPLIPVGRFAGDAPLVLEKPLVETGGVEAPASGQEREFIHVRDDALGKADTDTFRRIGIIEAFEVQILFGGGSLTLHPNGSSRPGIGANDVAALDPDPGVMMDNPAGAEKLNLAQLAAQVE